MVDCVWLKLGLVESFGCVNMKKKFQGKWDPLSRTCFTMPPCCIQPLGLYCGGLSRKYVVEFGVGSWYDHMRCHKKFHQQWIKRNSTPFTKLHSAPTDK